MFNLGRHRAHMGPKLELVNFDDVVFWLNGTNSASKTVVSGRVSEWRDFLGSGKYYYQTDPALQPNNNSAYVNFTSSNKKLIANTGSEFFFNQNIARSFLVKFRLNGDSIYGPIIGKQGGSTSPSSQLIATTWQSQSVRMYGLPDMGAPYGTDRMVVYTKDAVDVSGVQYDSFINGGGGGSNLQGTNFQGDVFDSVGMGSATSFNGWIYHLIYFNSRLNEQKARAWMSYIDSL